VYHQYLRHYAQSFSFNFKNIRWIGEEKCARRLIQFHCPLIQKRTKEI
jgi:hypothetical protein